MKEYIVSPGPYQISIKEPKLVTWGGEQAIRFSLVLGTKDRAVIVLPGFTFTELRGLQVPKSKWKNSWNANVVIPLKTLVDMQTIVAELLATDFPEVNLKGYFPE